MARPPDAKSSESLSHHDGRPSGHRLIGWSELCKRTSLSRSTIWRRMRDGHFPRPVTISKGRVAWIEAEVDYWIEARIDAARPRANPEAPP